MKVVRYVFRLTSCKWIFNWFSIIFEHAISIPLKCLCPFGLYFCKSISEIFILFHWSICYFTNTSILMIIALQKILKLGIVNTLTFFFPLNYCIRYSCEGFFACLFVFPYKHPKQFANIHKITSLDFSWDCVEIVLNL
jgi:hypothetical protein